MEPAYYTVKTCRAPSRSKPMVKSHSSCVIEPVSPAALLHPEQTVCNHFRRKCLHFWENKVEINPNRKFWNTDNSTTRSSDKKGFAWCPFILRIMQQSLFIHFGTLPRVSFTCKRKFCIKIYIQMVRVPLPTAARLKKSAPNEHSYQYSYRKACLRERLIFSCSQSEPKVLMIPVPWSRLSCTWIA